MSATISPNDDLVPCETTGGIIQDDILGVLSRVSPDAESLPSARICILSLDIFGPIKNGGIGTSYYYLATGLAKAGHDVTIIFPSQWGDDMPLEKWIDFYKDLGITFVIAPKPTVPDFWETNPIVRMARAAHDYLLTKDGEFDVIHTHELRGIGYFALNAKQQGLAFKDTLFSVTTHSPTMWNTEGNSRLVTQADTVIANFMEKRCVEMADIVMSPSQYMLRWCQKQGWPLDKEKCLVQPHLLPLPGRPIQAASTRIPLKELVFFGRMEERKGLDLFHKSLLRLDRKITQDVPITFLGKIGQGESRESIHQKFEPLSASCTIIDDFNREQAVSYLKEEGRIAVIPSLMDNSPMVICECLEQGIPFISTAVGGIPELLHPDDVEEVLAPPTPIDFCNRLNVLATKGGIVPRARFDYRKNQREWDLFHRSIVAKNRLDSSIRTEMRTGKDSPLISICLRHTTKSNHLMRAIKGIKAQTYHNIEIIIVDCTETHTPRQLPNALNESASALPITVVHGPDINRWNARNAGTAKARGKYVLILDSLDVPKPNLVKQFVDTAEQTNADIVTCALDIVECDHFPSDTDVKMRHSFIGPSLEAGLLFNCFGHACALIRKNVIDEMNGFTELFGIGRQDHDFFARVALEGKRIETLSEALCWFKRDYRRKGLYRYYDTNQEVARIFEAYRKHMPLQLLELFRIGLGCYEAQLRTKMNTSN